MNEMPDRIKTLRKNLKFTQDEFARKINISRSNLCNIENGTIGVTNRVIADICTVFNVNEKWLRTGEGEMFRKKTKEEDIEEIFGDVLKDNTSFKYHLLLALAQLDSAGWDAIEKFFKEVICELNKKEQS